MKIFVASIKNLKYIFLSILITAIICYMLFNSQIVVLSIKTNVDLFLYKLIPSVFPYIFLTNILIESGMIFNLSFGLSKIASKIFNITPICCPTVIISLLMGYPNAAKYITTLYANDLIDSKRAQMLLGFTSNASPAYIISTLGLAFYNSFALCIILLISHILSSLILGIILGIKYKNIIQQTSSISYIYPKKTKGFEVISNSIWNTLKTLGLIFCFMVIFSSITKLICNTLNLNKDFSAIISCIAEITNGLCDVSCANFDMIIKILITSFGLSFGSFMIIYQIYAVAHSCNVNLFVFIKHKVIQGILSTIITYVLLKISSFELPVTPVFSNLQNTGIQNYHSLFILFITIISIFFSLKFSKTKRLEKSLAV